MKSHKKKLLATVFFSVLSAIILIIHGIFFDLDFKQIERLTLGGFALTFVLVFFGLLILEWIFTSEEDEEIVRLKRRVRKLETIKTRTKPLKR